MFLDINICQLIICIIIACTLNVLTERFFFKRLRFGRININYNEVQWFDIEKYPFPLPLNGKFYDDSTEGYILLSDGNEITHTSFPDYNHKGELMMRIDKRVTHWARILPPNQKAKVCKKNQK